MQIAETITYMGAYNIVYGQYWYLKCSLSLPNPADQNTLLVEDVFLSLDWTLLLWRPD